MHVKPLQPTIVFLAWQCALCQVSASCAALLSHLLHLAMLQHSDSLHSNVDIIKDYRAIGCIHKEWKLLSQCISLAQHSFVVQSCGASSHISTGGHSV